MLGQSEELIHRRHTLGAQTSLLGGDQVREIAGEAFASVLRFAAGAGERIVVKGDGHISHEVFVQ